MDELTLDSFGRLLRREFPENLFGEHARADATSELDEAHGAQNVLSEDETAYWQAASDDPTPELILDFGQEKRFDSLFLQENIATGQQIEAFSIYIEHKNHWKRIGKYTVIGYKKICYFKKAHKARKIRIVFNQNRGKVTILRALAYKREELDTPTDNTQDLS